MSTISGGSIVRRIGAFIILITVVGLTYWLWPGDKPFDVNQFTNDSVNTTTDAPQGDTILLADTIPVTNTVDAVINTTTSSTVTTTEPIVTGIPNYATATLKVGDRTYELRFSEGDSLLYAMQLLTARSEQPFSFVSKEFKGIGVFVEEVTGTKNSPSENKYWIYYINGLSAQSGISAYIPETGDLIEWKYETPKL